ncbi:hypothetical protein ABBQ32_012418 [Trebouxia sp. C0010 RCD-2024]
MVDDDLELLRQLLDTSEDEDFGEAIIGSKTQEVCISVATNQATLRLEPVDAAPPNKKLKLTETAKPLMAGPASSVAHTVTPQAKTATVEKFSGLRMRNVCFPSVVLKERFSHVRFEKLSQARSKVGTDAKWATIAVVTEQHIKESAKGNVYGIWRLSDLQGTNVSMFLNGKAQADLSKETDGSLVAFFNPEARITDSKLSLSVQSAQQVVKLGTSIDMGFCRAKRKDGTPCRNAVNTGACPFCDYHVQDEYNKIHSKRTECKDSRLYRAFQYSDGSRLGSSGHPKMTEDGDILYAKPRSLKPRTQQQLQQTVERAQKHIPGAARLLAAMLPDQSAKAWKPGAKAAPKEYGPSAGNPMKPKRQAQAGSSSLHIPSPTLHNNKARPQVSGCPTGSSGGAAVVPTPRQQRLSEAQALRQSAGPEGGPEGGSLGSDGGTSPAGGGPDAEGGCFTEGADDLMIQEDGVEWGEEGGAGDPALQHAMALIRSKGLK